MESLDVNKSELKGSWPLKGSTVALVALVDAVVVVLVGGWELVEVLLARLKTLPVPAKGSLLKRSSPVAGAEVVEFD